MSWVLGELESPERLLAVARTLRTENVGELDMHTPFPVQGMEDALGLERSSIGWVAFVGGLVGAAGAYGMQWWFNVSQFPMNVANRPPHSPPVYVPVTFELMVLCASVTILVALVVGYWRFPRPHHPVFEHPPFVETASSTGWWVSVNTVEGERVRARLEALGAQHVAVLEP